MHTHTPHPNPHFHSPTSLYILALLGPFLQRITTLGPWLGLSRARCAPHPGGSREDLQVRKDRRQYRGRWSQRLPEVNGYPCMPGLHPQHRSCTREAGALRNWPRGALCRCPNTAQRLGASIAAYPARPGPHATSRPRPSRELGFVLECGLSFPRGLPGP